jgi:diguanylate cyclase (GGDEF)-like protein
MRSPAALAQRLVRSVEKLLSGVVGLVVCVGEAGQPQHRLLAAGQLDPTLAEWLAEAGPVADAPVCLSLEAVVLEAQAREQLQAVGGQALLLLPLTVAGERIGQVSALLPRMYRLTSSVSQTLTAMARTAALALQAAMERQELTAELAAVREQLAAVEGAFGKAEALIHAMQQQLQQQRGRDPATGLLSGRQFHFRLEVEVERARRYRDELGLLLLDIDQFRRFNEAHGRAEGERVLARLGEILRQELRKVDHAFRYGGEEFTVILPRCGQRALWELAERLRERFAAETFQIDEQKAQLSISIGAAAYRQGTSVGSFIRSADEALYRAKAEGRNRVVLA